MLKLPNLSSKELVDFCSYARKKYYLRAGYVGHRIYMGLKDKEDFKRSFKAFKKLSESIMK